MPDAWEKALRKSLLFEGVPQASYEKLLSRLGATERSYEVDELLVCLGDTASKIGVVLQGSVEVGFYDETGELATVSRMEPGDMFAEALACAGVPSVVQVSAPEPCCVLWMDAAKLLSGETQSSCPEAASVVVNLVRVLSRKNMFLNQKMQILTQKYVRDRIKVYLQGSLRCCEGGPGAACGSKPAGAASARVRVPYSRSGLARYLSVNRSALSRELGRLRDEGILSMEGDCIEVLRPDFLEA